MDGICGEKIKPDHSKNAGLKIGGSLSGADLVCDTFEAHDFEANLLKSSVAVQGFEPCKLI
jgi:hypothetical protein